MPVGALSVTPAPTVNDHWHEAYAFWLCGRWVTLRGTLEDPVDQAYVTSGIHSHDDGVIHIHPFTSAGSGQNATLGTFLAGYGVQLTDHSIAFPPGQGVDDVPVSCDGQPAELTVTVWPDAHERNVFDVYTGDLADIPLRDGAVMTIALTPGMSAPMPPSAADLDALAAADTAERAPTGP